MSKKADQLKEYRKNVLEFIDYLHENRSYMKDDVRTIERVRGIHEKQHHLKPKDNYKDARKFKELQTEMESELDNLTWNNLITSKAKELNLYEGDSTTDLRNNLNPAIHLDSIKPAEEAEIIEAKDKYLTFRKETGFCSFMTGLLFHDLDSALISFFGAFTDVSDMKRTKSEPPTPQPEADDEAKRPYNYNLFHGYKVKCLKEDWNSAKEIGYWEKNDDPRRGIKREASLSDIITHPKSNEIVDGIKNQYKNIKGKRLKLLLLALQELGLLPVERTAQKFYDCCKAEFGWYIATYQAMNGYPYNERTDETELESMKQYLESLMNP